MCVSSGPSGELVDRRWEPTDRLLRFFGTDEENPVQSRYLYNLLDIVVVLKFKKASDIVWETPGSFGTYYSH